MIEINNEYRIRIQKRTEVAKGSNFPKLKNDITVSVFLSPEEFVRHPKYKSFRSHIGGQFDWEKDCVVCFKIVGHAGHKPVKVVWYKKIFKWLNLRK